ncbi:MAG: Omp28-related outer membrane protein [Vicingaceae bacterium]|nr:Omp28-related outer membrane protein [Vicingaceae bacterium]
MKKLLLTTLSIAAGFGAFSQTFVSTAAQNKNVVLEELTGKTCQYCPDGHKRAQDLKNANPGRVVLLNIHTGGYAAGTPNYRSTWGDYVGGLYSVSGYPTGAVNRDDFGAGVMTSRGDWAANAATTLGTSSPVNVAGQASINLDTRALTLNVETYYTAAGTGTTNKLHVVIMQSNIAGPQTGGATYNPTAILPNGDYNHTHMVRHTLTPNAGDNIATISSGTFQANPYTYTIPTQINNIPVNLADLEIAVFVTEGAATGKVVTGDYASISFTTATPLGASNGAASMDASLGAVCGTTVDATMKITNMGNAALNTATVQYIVNGGTPATYQHTFTSPLATGQYEDITIPGIAGLTSGGASSNIDLSITMLNGSANPGTNTSAGHSVSTASTTQAGSTAGVINITTDRWGAETTWELYDETAGSAVASGGPYTNEAANGAYPQAAVNATLVDGNCYKFIVEDSYGDGMDGGFGTGTFSLVVGGTTVSSGGNFGDSDGEKFVLDVSTGINDNVSSNNVSIFPNPTKDVSVINFELTESTLVEMEVVNSVGSIVNNSSQTMNSGAQKITFDGTELPNGIYFVNLTLGNKVITKKISLIK